jgi:D-ribose pyranose/furanose isomerase RbsD
MGGSSILNTNELAEALSTNGMFNVTIICPYDVPVPESEFIHKFALDFSLEELFPAD